MGHWDDIWDSLDSTEIGDTTYMYDYYKEFLGNKIKGKRILEIGCGTGVNSILMAAAGAKVSVMDYSKEALEVVNKLSANLDIELIHMDMFKSDIRNKYDIVHSEGVWLYDIDGNRYLDAYNNVSHVGHCHPHVANAIAKQSHRLNTSTRYLHGYILELAERITKMMPKPLSTCMFVCTGSEANELAWQMSKVVSGNNGALITKFSYHGSTSAIKQFSTESIPQEKLPTHVQTLFAPTSDTTYLKPDSGFDIAITELNKHGHQPAMLLLDTAFVSDGIYTSPKGYLRILFAKTREAGGLCVADEVQSGFGRLGQHFWGFQFDDVIPDIVTMGKPMGNGHPIAAVVTRPEIADALAKESGYFNTFGGNPVSCAAGLAVLDVIEKEALHENAREVGQFLRERLEMLRKKYPVLGEIHGSGLLQGIDILKPDETPAPDLADEIMNNMRESGVLIGTTGPSYSTLKIRPPIVFHREHVEILIAALVKALDR